MIVVVEGVSAAGKTTWCARHVGRVVPELAGLAPPSNEPQALAKFWTSAHCNRWAEAERIEAGQRIAYCDTDPIKLHYTWCLWRLGQSTRNEWDAAVNAHRVAIQSRRLGFADAVVFLEPHSTTICSQKEMDRSRQRRNFELHLRIGPMLREWYELIEQARPGRIVWHGERISEVETINSTHDRFDLALFDQLTAMAARRAG